MCLRKGNVLLLQHPAGLVNLARAPFIQGPLERILGCHAMEEGPSCGLVPVQVSSCTGSQA